MFIIDLGSKVKSDISGFIGTVTSRSEHINGCNRYWVDPGVDKDGKLREGTWLDEAELKTISITNLKRKNNNMGGFPSKIK